MTGNEHTTTDPALRQFRLIATIRRAAELDKQGYRFEAQRETGVYTCETPDAWYLITMTGENRFVCTCADFKHRGEDHGICKHIVGLVLQQATLDNQRAAHLREEEKLGFADPFWGVPEYELARTN